MAKTLLARAGADATAPAGATAAGVRAGAIRLLRRGGEADATTAGARPDGDGAPHRRPDRP